MEFPHIDDMKSSATPDEEIQKLKDSLYSIDLNIEKIEFQFSIITTLINVNILKITNHLFCIFL